MTKPLPSQERLEECFLYDGSHLVNRIARGSKAPVGRTFGAVDKNGYIAGFVDGQRYYEHRLVWKMQYGSEPSVIDHINEDKTDNRLDNLQVLSSGQNCRKSRKPKASGLPMNVYRYYDRFKVRRMVDGVERHVGIFSTLEEALVARDAL